MDVFPLSERPHRSSIALPSVWTASCWESVESATWKAGAWRWKEPMEYLGERGGEMGVYAMRGKGDGEGGGTGVQRGGREDGKGRWVSVRRWGWEASVWVKVHRLARIFPESSLRWSLKAAGSWIGIATFFHQLWHRNTEVTLHYSVAEFQNNMCQ